MKAIIATVPTEQMLPIYLSSEVYFRKLDVTSKIQMYYCHRNNSNSLSSPHAERVGELAMCSINYFSDLHKSGS